VTATGWTLAAVGACAALAAGAATYALWSSEDTFAGGLLTAGDLDMTTGQATWEQVTPGVADPQSGILDATPPDFISMPGDVLQIVQPVTTSLEGSNLNAGFSVDLADRVAGVPDVDAGRIALSFHVADAAGNQVAPEHGSAELGSVVAVPGLSAGAAGRDDDWTVVVRIDVLDDYRWEPTTAAAAPIQWAASSVVVRLEQIRQGDGFTSPGDAS
jgi:alternate signal-mediated exported protein